MCSCTLPLIKSPKEWHKTRFCCFASKIQLLSKKSATKFLCVKTSSGKVVATSFLSLTVHRRITGNVPIYLKFAVKVTHPFRKRRFRMISLNSAAAVRASDKSSIIANKKSTTRFPSSHGWTLCVTCVFFWKISDVILKTVRDTVRDVWKFCRLSWCSASRGFVSDSWATCCQ